MTLIAEAAQLVNGNPGLAALVGSAIGGGVASLAAVRRGFRVEAREGNEAVPGVVPVLNHGRPGWAAEGAE